MTWYAMKDNWADKLIPAEECNFAHLFVGMDGHAAPTGHWSFIMAGIAMYCDMKRVVEIGVWQGATSVCLAQAMKRTGGLAVGIDVDECVNAKARIAKYELQDHWAFIQGNSSAIGYDMVPIDLLFIDGGHSEEQCTQDWQRWTSYVREGGWVFIDNTVSEPGVRPFLVKLMSDQHFQWEWQYILCQKSYGMGIFKKRQKYEIQRINDGTQDVYQ